VFQGHYRYIFSFLIPIPNRSASHIERKKNYKNLNVYEISWFLLAIRFLIEISHRCVDQKPGTLHTGNWTTAWKQWKIYSFMIYSLTLGSLFPKQGYLRKSGNADSWNGSNLVWAYRYHMRLYVLTSVLPLNWRFVFGALKRDWLLILALQTTFNLHYFSFVVLVLGLNSYSCTYDYHRQKHNKELYFFL
jgi:hypothetical protein